VNASPIAGLCPLAKLENIVGSDAACAFLAARGRRRPTVGDLAELERLRPLPAACYRATVEATNLVGSSALVPFEGNAYSVPPGLIGADVKVRHRLGTGGIEIVSHAGYSSPATTARRRTAATWCGTPPTNGS
jgi:hypothetical protein